MAFLGLVLALLTAVYWALGAAGVDGTGRAGSAKEQEVASQEDLYSGPMPSPQDPEQINDREAVVTPFFGVVLDAIGKEPVPFLDLVAVHWPKGTEELPAMDEGKLHALTRSSMGAETQEYATQTDKFGRFEIPLRGMKGHLALKATDGPEARRVAMKRGFTMWLEELPKDLAVAQNPLKFTAAIGPTLAVNLTPPGKLKISFVLESTKLAAKGEGPLFHAYLDMRGDTREGVDWYQVRYDVHPALERIYVDAFTDQGFPERVSHTAAWIRLPEVPASERAPGGQFITMHAQDEEGLLAGSGVIPIVQGIQANAVELALTRRGVIEGRVLNTRGLGVPGQRIQLRSLELNEFPFVRGKGERLVTNATGEFRIECVSEGDWQLQSWGGSSALDMLSSFPTGVGVPLLLAIAPEIGATKNVVLEWGTPLEIRNEVLLVVSPSELTSSVGLNSKLRIAERNALQDVESESTIAGVLRPTSANLAEIVPTIPVTANFQKRDGNGATFLLAYPNVPEGAYEILLANTLQGAEGGVAWESGSTTWTAGGDPVEIRGTIAPPPGGRPWQDPITNGPAAFTKHMWMWRDRHGPISGWGLENSPDGEPELIVRDGKKVTGILLAGQRLLGLGKDLAPVLEPKPRPFTEEQIRVESMRANAGWGVVLHVSIDAPDTIRFTDLGEMKLEADKGLDRKAEREREKRDRAQRKEWAFVASGSTPLPGAKILVDGAFAARTDGMGTAFLGTDIPPARIVVDYPGYHMLQVIDDKTFLPLEAPPIGQLVYRVVMIRN